ncbi:hypothetical protein [Actinoalloteichus caeruleus]|uniref:hypothetical protein n=1 Tax=Actinoalloteichus cyanogriseus TaxID=2893586 RepID=UPI0004AA1298|nr:hypothetical protein [Actinoalloteichus caeruleus]
MIASDWNSCEPPRLDLPHVERICLAAPLAGDEPCVRDGARVTGRARDPVPHHRRRLGSAARRDGRLVAHWLTGSGRPLVTAVPDAASPVDALTGPAAGRELDGGAPERAEAGWGGDRG